MKRGGNGYNRTVKDVKTLCKQGRLEEALQILHSTEQSVDSSTYVSLLEVCIKKRALSEGRIIQTHMKERGFMTDRFLGNKLINMYAKCGSLKEARRVFDEMPKRDSFSWTVMISACVKNGFDKEALALYHQMQRTGIKPNEFTFASVLPACINLGALEQGKEIHEEIIKCGCQSDVFVGNGLIDMYGKCGVLEFARDVFDKMPARDTVSWTAMIAGYVQNGQGAEALKLFRQMWYAGVNPNLKTFTSIITACANLSALEQGKEIHHEMCRRGFEFDVFAESALLDMYAKCGCIEHARELFDKMPERDLVSWNAMVSGYSKNTLVDEALTLFQEMPERNIVSWNGMIAGVAQNGLCDEALKILQEMPERDVVSWTAIVAGYAQNGHFNEALKVFRDMWMDGIMPNSETYASVLPACANLAALEQGKEVHEDIIRSGFQSDVFVGSALIDMYAKCGSIEFAGQVFSKMPERDVVSWNAMITGYAMHGCGREALEIFQQMQHSGKSPNHVTFVGILSACCHAGLVDEGLQYFDCMSQHYHITPTMEHYCCMVDLLSRTGLLDEAWDFINKMPINPNAAVWSSLLAACRNHSNVELGERAAEHLFELDPENSGPYVLLSNLYATTGRWDEIRKIRKMMKEKGVEKMPGCSWIEVNKQVYAFCIGDRSLPDMEKIYAELERLYGKMKEEGHVPKTKFVLNDVEEEQKEHILYYHSEKLATVFGLINTAPGTPIRVVKNLRVCGDCHSTIKFISNIVAREIVMRDTVRFHHFKDGQCSCGDYW